MNARGIPAQSEQENLEKEFSYTINEMTGERVPYGQEAKAPSAFSPPPAGDPQQKAASTSSEPQKAESTASTTDTRSKRSRSE